MDVLIQDFLLQRTAGRDSNGAGRGFSHAAAEIMTL